MFDTPPAWAYSWCYIAAITAFLTLVSGLLVLVQLYKKLDALTAVLFVFHILFVCATLMTAFWTCRVSLKQYSV
jgi:hypothetical protein